MATKSNKAQTKSTGRPKPLIAKAGFTKTRRRYPDGGKVTK